MPIGESTLGNFIGKAVMRGRHLLAAVAVLFVVLAAIDVALTAFAAPGAGAASDLAPPVAPLLFGDD
jgi:hypothetical protein